MAKRRRKSHKKRKHHGGKIPLSVLVKRHKKLGALIAKRK